MILPHIKFMHQGRYRQAESILRSALLMDPENSGLRTDLAVCYQDQGNIDRAEKAYRYILSRWPEQFAAASNLGDILLKSGRSEEAALIFRDRFDKTGQAENLSALSHVLIEQLRIDEALDLLKQVQSLSKHNPFHMSEYLSYSLHKEHDVEGHRDWLAHHAKMFDHKRNPDPQQTAPKLAWDGKRPLRIAFIGNVFREHACAYVLEPILEHTKHETVIYADNIVRDATSDRLKAKARYWRDTYTYGYDQFYHMLKLDKIDVVVDLMGHKDGNRALVLARQPVPIMLGYIGYPGDTGLVENIDREVGWAYRPSDNAPNVAQLPYDRNKFVTFGSVHRAAKLTQPVLAAWAKVLSCVSDARLLVKVASGHKNAPARQQMALAGLPMDRVDLLDQVKDRIGYLAIANHIDIHMDSFPYNGGAVTYDMLWQGVPTVTNLVEAHSNGLSPLFPASSTEHYIQRLVALANDPAMLRHFRATCRTLLPDPAAVTARFDEAITSRALKITGQNKCCGDNQTGD